MIINPAQAYCLAFSLLSNSLLFLLTLLPHPYLTHILTFAFPLSPPPCFTPLSSSPFLSPLIDAVLLLSLSEACTELVLRARAMQGRVRG